MAGNRHYLWLVPLRAQLGARLSGRIRGGWIIRGLAVALGLVAIRVLMLAMEKP